MPRRKDPGLFMVYFKFHKVLLNGYLVTAELCGLFSHEIKGNISDISQGGESRDFLQLFCTCIRTDRVRKMVIIYLILNEFLCSKVEKPCIYSQRRNIYVFLCYTLFFSTQVRAKTLIHCSSLCGKIHCA